MRWTMNTTVLTWPGLSPAAKIAWHQLSNLCKVQAGVFHGGDVVTTSAAIANGQDLGRTRVHEVLMELQAAGLVRVLEVASGRRHSMRLSVQKPDPRRTFGVRDTEHEVSRTLSVRDTERQNEAHRPQAERAKRLAATAAENGLQITVASSLPAIPYIPACARHVDVEKAKLSLQRSTVSTTTDNVYGSACARAGERDEISRLAGIGDVLAQVLARVPTEPEQKDRIVEHLAGWLNDPTLHPSVLRRAAEAVVFGRVEYSAIARVVSDVMGMRYSKKGLKRPAGALFIHLCRERGIECVKGSSTAARAQ
jgi:hypothetical protein